MNKKTVIIGATTKRDRYAYLAAERLTSHGHEIVPLGIREGEVFGKQILKLAETPEVQNVDTITMYINPTRQQEWEDYLLSLKPKRIIFNPGTENPTFAQKASEQGVEVVEGCTLVMLGARNF